jgi:hypothetical protein
LNDDLTSASHLKQLLAALDHPLSFPHPSSPGKQTPAIAFASQVNAGQLMNGGSNGLWRNSAAYT